MLKSSTDYVHEMTESNNAVVSKIVDAIPVPIPHVSAKHISQKALSQRQLLTSGILELKVPGNSLLQAGDIITFDMPIMEPTGHNKPIESSPYWSGRYLIYDIKHMIDRQDDRYSLQIRAVKDTVAHPYVAEYGSWSHMAPAPGTHNIYKEDNELLTRMTNAQGLTS